jgi:hypothetical protein
LVPKLKAMPGFKGCCAFGSEDGLVASVSIFDGRPWAMAANDAARSWVGEKLHPPHVLAGRSFVLSFAAGPDHAPQT